MRYWKNSAFQTIAFIVMRCHTADEAHRKVVEALDERTDTLTKHEFALRRNRLRLSRLRKHASIQCYDKDIDTFDEDIELDEVQYTIQRSDVAMAATRDEIAFLQDLKESIEPYRKYRNMPLSDSYQLVQREEWALEFISRAQGYVQSIGTIPPDQYMAMKSHPDFETTIAPAIQQIREGMSIPAPEFHKVLTKKIKNPLRLEEKKDATTVL